MTLIHVLPEDLINKIAAGEVIERPSSVVKELVENAIDAQATKITIETQGAGSRLIRVTDNGSGMSKEELKLALERHATSKISSLDDLFHIQTLGFRGEALPSIASVSKMELKSRTNQTQGGAQIILEGGKVLSNEDCGAPVGTTLTVKELFFNTPARKKFLKAPATEINQIADIVNKYALANPQIAFELISDGKPLLTTSGSGKLADVILAIYGLDLAQSLLPVEQTFKYGRVFGLTSQPNISRLDKNYETFFVNHRYVKNFLLNRALEEAYRTLIPGNRYPAAVIFIEIDPAQIDVNVHPTKREIKFAKNQEVMEAITSAVKLALEKVREQRLGLGTEGIGNQGIEASRHQGHEGSWKSEMLDILMDAKQAFDLSIQPAESLPQAETLPLLPLGQINQTYIVATDGQDMVLIDQHAAHERILYDKLSSQAIENNFISNQNLLLPETIELTVNEANLLADNLNYLNSLGFDLAEFGPQTFLMRGVPTMISNSSAKETLKDILSELEELERSAQVNVKQERIRKYLACHGAIKAGDKLSFQEMGQLIKQLHTTTNPLTCPHGRPTLIRFSEAELNRRFGR
ncbi:DNA mismatch repair endonuclease MutL [Candidatus Saganbacteria bacterium]|nr:DNA mismatch repair endonuclease MutL [Candidatus Saganbacteria bacterium]